MKSIIWRLALGGFAAAGMIIAVVTCGDHDGPTKPPPVEPVDYPVYFCENAPSPNLYIYHPLTREIDSVRTPWPETISITVSADGRRLYVVLRNSVMVVDIETLSVIADLPYENVRYPVAVSPDNRYLAIPGNDLCVLRTSDYSVVFSDTDVVMDGCFSSDSKTFYCSAGLSPYGRGVVYRLDLSEGTFSVTRRRFEEGSVVQVVPSPNEDKWFLYLGLGMWVSAFAVYDVPADSLIYMHVMAPGYGYLAVDPEGRRVFYTNPGRTATDPFPDPCFYIYDVQANQLEREVCDLDFFSDSTWYMVPNRLVVTPDGRWLAMLGGAMALQVLYLYDIAEGTLVHREHFGGANNKTFTNLTVQTDK